MKNLANDLKNILYLSIRLNMKISSESFNYFAGLALKLANCNKNAPYNPKEIEKNNI